MTLKKLRLQTGLKAYKVAELLNISPRQLIRIEKGEVKNIESHINKMAEIYKVTIQQIKEAWEVSKDGRGNSK